ncbi:MAG TPA: pilus assembly protein PilP [Mariprofundaceae bacterium]|nr:pilus assembly protein PilP [Mariprofundaceae bacterium]
MLRPYTVMLCMLFAATAAHAQSADKIPAGKPNVAAEESTPKATQHMVKAPAVDIEAVRDPFASYLSRVAQRKQAILAKHRANLATRPHEELENFDLSTLTLVAVMSMGDRRAAMVQDPEGKGYMVKVGNYMGKNNGRITKISSAGLTLVEQVLDPAGDIVNRKVTMTLKEVNP